MDTDHPKHELSGTLLEDDALADEALEKQAKLASKLQIARWERVFMNPDGAAVLWDILDTCGFCGHKDGGARDCATHGTSFTGNSTTFFLEGKRAVGNWILMQLNALRPDRLAQICNLAQIEGDESNE